LLAGASFLDDFVQRFISELQLPEGENQTVFYDQRPPRSWPQLLERAREYGHGGNLFVAVLSRGNAKDMRDLEELWEQESPGLKWFFFKGIFEWPYGKRKSCLPIVSSGVSSTSTSSSKITELLEGGGDRRNAFALSIQPSGH
jgi:hypothetical protein